MWFDVKAALLEIEGSTPAIPAIREGELPQNGSGIAEIAGIAAPHGDNSLFVKTDNIEFQERAGIIAGNPDIPEQWVEGMAVLVSMPLPAMWNQQHWDRILINAESFMAKWGAQAHRLGWSANDLFGISQSGSVARVDRLGLVLMLDDKQVTHMTNETAALQCLNIHTGEPNGSTLTFYRKPDMSGSSPVWQLTSTS